MFQVRSFRARIPFYFLLLPLLVCSIPLSAQESGAEKEKDKAEKSGSVRKLIDVKGSVRCAKPDPSYSIEVPDRPGHALKLAKRKCTWTEPMVIMGARSKDGIAVEFPEQMEGTLHTHGFEVDTYGNG
ncbi:MAG: hypothetical protein ABSD39_19735, partial [Terriglobales bacterium]